MSKAFQRTPAESRKLVFFGVIRGITNWIIEAVSMPLWMLSIVILRVGGVLIELTGGKASAREGLDAVALRGILIALFIYGAIQYSQQAGAVAASISWLPTWGGLLIGMSLNVATQILQARALRKDRLQDKKDAFYMASERRIHDDEMEDLVDIAKARAKQYNRSEMAKFRVMGFFAFGAWLAEAWVMGSSPAIPWVSPWFSFPNLFSLILSVALTFAFEVFAQMDEES